MFNLKKFKVKLLEELLQSELILRKSGLGDPNLLIDIKKELKKRRKNAKLSVTR